MQLRVEQCSVVDDLTDLDLQTTRGVGVC